MPIQTNIDFGIGPDDGFRITSNIHPVVPITVNDKWNVISRTILPVIYQSDVTGPGQSEFGLGVTVQSFFFPPQAGRRERDHLGGGPAFLLPTGTRNELTAKKWGAGPTGVCSSRPGR